MCHQTVGLVQGFIETEGIPTVSIALLKEVAISVASPRTLWVPYPLGYPFGEPSRPQLQGRIILSALALLSQRSPEPILVDLAA